MTSTRRSSAADAPSVLVIGGSPGSGKTSVARHLAAGTPTSVHLEADWFYRFVAHRVDPSLPEARSQNDTVVRAFAEAARTYREGGYVVFVDGVVGPWLLPVIAPILGAFDYVMLHAAESVVLDRARRRPDQGSAVPSLVSRMHRQFEAVRARVDRHVVVTDGRSIAEVADEVASRRAQGGLRLEGVG